MCQLARRFRRNSITVRGHRVGCRPVPAGTWRAATAASPPPARQSCIAPSYSCARMAATPFIRLAQIADYQHQAVVRPLAAIGCDIFSDPIGLILAGELADEVGLNAVGRENQEV